MHLLSADHAIAFLIRVAALAIGAASLVFAVWLLNLMRRQHIQHRATERL